MNKPLTNYAFIDAQNLNLGVQELGWRLDWRRFRVFLAEKYAVKIAYVFLGFVVEYQNLYRSLQRDGFVLIFKEVTRRADGRPKGNVDAELVLQAMIDYADYEQAVIVTSDGDFACLVRYLYAKNKLARVLGPNRDKCSALLKKAAKERMDFLDQERRKLEHK